MKSNIEKVYSKLPKVELAEVELSKVELSIIDDIESKKSKALSESLNASKLAQQSIAAYDSSAQLYAEAESLANRAIPQAKDLGAKQLVKELQNKIKNISSNLKRANATSKKIKSSI